MNRKTLPKLSLLISAGMLWFSSANAEERQKSRNIPDKIVQTFGPSGLLGQLAQNDNYGQILVRQGQNRSRIAAIRQSGITQGYKDNGTRVVSPISAYLRLPDDRSAIVLKGTFNHLDAERNLTYGDVGVRTLQAQYLMMPSNTSLLSFGVFIGRTDAKLEHVNGKIDQSNWGLRIDYLQNLSRTWGFASRFEYRLNDTETTIPLGFTDLVTHQDSEALYSEIAFVGTYRKSSLGVIPEGWFARPKLGATYLRTTFDGTINSLGAPVSGTIGDYDEYATLFAKVRMEKNMFVPGKLAPYIELGYEHEAVNDLDAGIDGSGFALSKIGVSYRTRSNGRLELSYTRNDRIGGDQNLKTLNLLFTQVF